MFRLYTSSKNLPDLTNRNPQMITRMAEPTSNWGSPMSTNFWIQKVFDITQQCFACTPLPNCFNRLNSFVKTVQIRPRVKIVTFLWNVSVAFLLWPLNNSWPFLSLWGAWYLRSSVVCKNHMWLVFHPHD